MELPDGTLRSVPVSWTDATAEVNAYASVGGARSLFRVEDLLELVALVSGGEQ